MSGFQESLWLVEQTTVVLIIPLQVQREGKTTVLKSVGGLRIILGAKLDAAFEGVNPEHKEF